MTPSSPVLVGENFPEIELGKDQPEYQVLPVVHCGEGILLSRWELSDKELEQIQITRSVYVFQHTFGQPAMPFLLQVETPEVVES